MSIRRTFGNRLKRTCDCFVGEADKMTKAEKFKSNRACFRGTYCNSIVCLLLTVFVLFFLLSSSPVFAQTDDFIPTVTVEPDREISIMPVDPPEELNMTVEVSEGVVEAPVVSKPTESKAGEAVESVIVETARDTVSIGETATPYKIIGKPRVIVVNATAEAEEERTVEGEEVEGSYTVLSDIQVVSAAEGITVTAVAAQSETPISVTAVGETAVIECESVQAVTTSKVSVEKGGLYMVSEEDVKTEITVMPDKAQEIVEAEMQVLRVEKIELEVEEDEPVYTLDYEQEGKLLAFIPVTVNVKTKVNAVTGELKETKKPWWSFLVI